jgi:hypothetical protein
MRNRVTQGCFTPTLCAILLILGNSTLRAETADDWQFAVGVYIWGADIGGSSGNGDDIEVEFDDIIDGLNAGFMGTFEARKDKWLIITDLVHLDVTADDSASATAPVGPGDTAIEIRTDVEVDLVGTVPACRRL